MTLDEAIKKAEEVAEKCEFDTDWGMGNHFIDRSGVADIIKCGKEHRQLAEWLRELKQLREQTKWISVSERLPEKNVEVLATTQWGAVTIAEMYSANDWFIHEGTTNAEIDEIVAWMPLPEPYKAESEG